MATPKKSKATSSARPASRPAAPRTAKRAAVKPVAKPVAVKPAAKPAPKVEPSAAATPAALAALRADLAAVRRLIEQQRPAPAASAAGLDDEVDTLRRVVGDALERRMEPVIGDLAAIRVAAASLPAEAAAQFVAKLDKVMASLGALPYDAQRLDMLDPLIHSVGREDQDPALPAGIITATLRPGIRTGRGLVVAKALVAVNRRG